MAWISRTLLNRRIVICLFLLAALGGTLFALARIGNKPPREQTPDEKYQHLVEHFKETHKQLEAAYRAAHAEKRPIPRDIVELADADRHAAQFLALMQAYPNHPAALDAFRWLQENTSTRSGWAAKALPIIIQHWIEDIQIAHLCQGLMQHDSEVGDKLLLAAIEKNPHRNVQAYARMALAHSQESAADRKPTKKDAQERAALEKKAESLLQAIVENYADVLDPRNPEITLSKAADKKLYELRHLTVGHEAPEIEVADCNDQKMKLSDFRGQVVLVVFWGTWSPPCKANVPHEQALLKQYEGKPFVVVGVNSDIDRQTPQKFCSENHITWQSFWDGGVKGPIADQWNVHSWPTFYLLDANGVIRYRNDYLQGTLVRQGMDGKLMQVPCLDEAVGELVKELSAEK
ncbi:MAG TPA: TlpA disulfide reductase family protein [Gemmataceae bacterium]|nr:TlpA disulfide reductase family protein [Gemmataceae bacterium]